MKELRDLEVAETLSAIKGYTEDVDGSEWAINNVFAIYNAVDSLKGQNPEELKTTTKVLTEALVGDYTSMLKSYISTSRLLIVLLTEIDFILYALKQSNKQNELWYALNGLVEELYNNLISAGIVTKAERAGYRKQVIDIYTEGPSDGA